RRSESPLKTVLFCYGRQANLANRKEDLMLEKYFSAPKTLARLRAGLSGPHIDGFAETLEREGYSHGAALRYLRAAAHLGQFQRRRHATLSDIDAKTLDDFRQHLRRMKRTGNKDMLTRSIKSMRESYCLTHHHGDEGLPTVSQLPKLLSIGPQASDSELGPLAAGNIACKSYREGGRSARR